METRTNRRSALKRVGLALAATFGLSKGVSRAGAAKKEVLGESVVKSNRAPLFSGGVKHGNTLYIAGKGAHFAGDIKAHTDHVLKELEKELKRNGSSMEQVLKVNVYLHDLADYKGMNEVYRGRFGQNPPVRTTVAVYGGVPGDSLVEIDCIAAVD